ncbi:MAG: class I SAM-dependent methyltransferase [Mariprofundus sp.]|nr:class I SAM-dependent methyltransferase [Mariprofundus sp.]
MKVVNKVLRVLNRLRNKEAFNSGEYWESRYKMGGGSGAGSYSNLAIFKADYINDFVFENQIQSVIEFGSGDGNQLSLAKYTSYLGLDVSEEALKICKQMFCEDKSKRFMNYNDFSFEQADLTLSLDVIYHLVEDLVYENYMAKLFKASKKWVIIYSSNYNELGSKHVRHRRFIDWIAVNQKNYSLSAIVKNKYPFSEGNLEHTSPADFYVFVRK